ncbi:DUF2585 domain-containing protein [Paracoccus zhejiangensis]|uniref:Uncharacterized protein n=1 Tax=Paracoccus zhejiangensis TaxID=1077935 RepID=A0A2H5F183_9RHOB|nr:DUF2585 domain-containing protein [Paracoccus zhejiangensis]AUH65318.1 hypothetical protein CX676_15040 [Paracoccus zhejiangensis]
MGRLSPWHLVALIVLATAGFLLFLGRVPICDCGYVKLWHGVTNSSGNSQHLTDWYTPSHVLHGLLFFAMLHVLLPRVAIGWRLVLATLVEAGWEIAENTSMVIERYRAVTISLDYYGDAVVNSVGDMLAMMLGFWLARVLPVWLSVALFLGTEAVTIWFIRDGLILNVLMLLWPIEALRQWQAAG